MSVPSGKHNSERVWISRRVRILSPESSVWGRAREKSIDRSIKPNPHTALVRYGARTLSFEQKRPPSSAVTKMATYPIGSTSDVGSGVARAIAVPIRSRTSPIALVMSSPTPPVRSVF